MDLKLQNNDMQSLEGSENKNCIVEKDEVNLKMKDPQTGDAISVCSIVSDFTNTSLGRVGSFSSVNVEHSKDVHFGNKIFAAPITLVNNLEENIGDKPKTRGFCPRAIERMRNSTWKEKAECVAAIIFMLTTAVVLAVYFNVYYNTEAVNNLDLSDPNADWFVDREGWLALPAIEGVLPNTEYRPIRYAVLGHTVTLPCYTRDTCAAEARYIQRYFMNSLDYSDIGYNFIVGGDGRIYEGRGWYQVGGHTRGFNEISIGINFIGNYQVLSGNHLREIQVNSTHKLLEQGLKLGVLSDDYSVVCHCEVRGSASPGGNAYKEIITWRRYKKLFNLTCDP